MAPALTAFCVGIEAARSGANCALYTSRLLRSALRSKRDVYKAQFAPERAASIPTQKAVSAGAILEISPTGKTV